jgi:putative FmdB family regulatory protein
MPLYTYECKQCGNRHEEHQTMNDRKVPESVPCTVCGGDVQQIIVSGPSICNQGTRGLTTPSWFKDRIGNLNKETGASLSVIK